MAGFNCDIFVVVSISLVFVLCSVNAFAQLADTMLCADETCSETISEGEARLAYRPRDENFLNLKKGDVVLVKSKNAGKKTHLWGGQVMGSLRFGFFPSSFIKEYMVIHDPPKVAVSIQDFLKGRSPQPTNDPFSNLVAEKQKITFEKSKKLDQENQQRFANSEDEKPPSVDEAVKVVTAGSQKDDVGLQQQENVRSTDVKMVSGESQDQLPNPGEGDEERSDEGREQMTKQDHHTKEEDAEERKENVEMKELNPEIANVINNNPNTESTDSNSSEKGTSTDHGNGKGTGEMPPDIAALLGDVKSVGDEQKIVDPGKVDENPQAAPESKEEAVEKELEPGKKDLKESEKEQHTEENKKIEENTSTDKSDEFQSSEMDNRKESSHTQKSVVQLANQDLQKDENKKEEPNTESHNTEENYTATDSPHNDKSSLSEKDQQEKPDEVGEQSTESNAEHATKTTVPLSEKDPNATEEKEHETKPLSTGENKLSPDSPQENQAETKSVSSENDQQEKPNDVEKQITENDVEHITKTTEPQPPESDPSADTGNQGLADNQSNENKIENIDPDTPTPVDQEKFVVDTVAEEDGTEQSKGEMDDSTVRASEIDQGVQDKVVDSAVLGHQSQSYKIDPDPAVLDDENVSDGTKSSHDSDSTLKEGTDKQSPTDNETNESDNDKTELNGQSQNLPSSSDINNADTDPKKMESEKGQIVDEKGKMNQDSEEEPSANQIEPEESDQAPSNEPTKTSDGGDKAEELNNKSSDTEQEQERNVNDDMEKHEIEKPDDSTIPPEKVEQESESHTNAEETRKSDDVASKDSDSSDEKLHSGHDEQEKKVSENDKNDKVNMAKLEEIDSVDEPEKTEDTQTQETVDGNERPTADNSPKQEGDDHKLSKTDPVNINSDEKNTETELSNDFPRQDSGIETKDSSKDNVVTTQSSETTEDSLDHDKNVEDISSQPKTEPENGDSKDGDQETAQNVGNGSEVQTDAEKVRDEPKGNMEQGDSQEDRQETAHSQSNDSQQGERNDQAVEKINENVVQQQSIHEQRGVVSEKTGTVQEDSDSSNVSDDGIAPDGNQNNLSDSNTEPGKAVEEHPQPTGKIDIDSSVLQMENSKNKELHQSALSNDKKSEERSGEYNVLHEGKVVNWDETLDEKSASEKKVGWDESLGAETDNEHILEALEIAKKEKVVDATRDNSIKDEIDSDTVTKQPSGEDAEPELTPPTTVTTLETLVTEQVTPETDTSQQFTETVTTPTPDLQLETTLPPQHVDTTDSILAYETNKTAAQEVKSHLSVSTEKSDEKDNVDPDEEETLHAESFWLRLLLVFSKLPYDIIYILEPLFNAWITLLPEEYRNDVYGVSWTIIISTFFCGLILIWLLICRSQSVKRKHRDQSTAATIQELKTQLENLSQEKVQAENELRTKQNEVEIQKGQVETVTEEKNATLAMKTGLENSLRELNKETETLKREMQILNQNLQDKDNAMQEVLTNSQQVETSLLAQKEAITKYEGEIKQLRGAITKHENNQKTAEASNEKLKERIKTLEKAKSETKKEGKTLKDQIEKLNNRIGELQERLDNEIEDSENKKQEIDVLKDCILQFKGVQEYLNDEGEDGETEEAIIKQKEKMKSMLDVANVKSVLRQTETEKLHVTYELEAERKSRQDTEGKVSELEATIKGNEAIKDELERQKRMLESKLTVMEEFYAKREVEIQSKLGLEQSKRESNASMLEDQQQQRLEILQQLDAYKKMSEDAKKKYEDSDRQHKQEILSFEKKSHDNWLACRDAERKTEEANKQISHLQLELTDMRRRLHDSHDRDPIIRPRPERYGPPGAPPLFGPPRRGPPPPGVPDSPLHFRSGPPPDADRRSPPPHHRRPPSPGGSIPGDRPPSRPDRPPSRPDRPPSTHSLPPMDRRSMPGPPPGPGQPYSNTPPGREFRPYRDAMPPRGPPRDRAYPPPPGARMGSGPANSSPYMERPPIPSSQSPGPRSQNFTQSSLHATPPQSTGDGLRNDGYQPPPAASTGPPPPGSGPHGGSNPFRRSKP